MKSIKANLTSDCVVRDLPPALRKVTGWPAGLMQDDCRKLSKWFASRPDARMRAREAVAAIHASKP